VDANNNDRDYKLTKVQGFKVFTTKGVKLRNPDWRKDLSPYLFELMRATPRHMHKIYAQTSIYINEHFFQSEEMQDWTAWNWSG
jgi:hypothetical protein